MEFEFVVEAIIRQDRGIGEANRYGQNCIIKLHRESSRGEWGESGEIRLRTNDKLIADQFVVSSSYKVTFKKI